MGNSSNLEGEVMKRFGSFYALLVGAALVASVVPAFSDDRQAPPDTNYKVKQGDTLWDLSGAFLKDPFRWPVINKANPDIKNPHWIYPGQKLAIPGLPSEAAKPAGPAEAEEKAAPAPERPGEPFVEMGKTIVKKPLGGDKVIKLESGPPQKTPVTSLAEAAAAGFVSEDGARVYKISGDTLDERTIYAEGDELLLKDGGGLPKGQLLLAGRPMGKVKDPVTGEKLGALIEITGIIRVTGEEGGKMACVIDKSFREVRKNDLLYPYTAQPPVYEPVPVNDALKGKTCYVVATDMKKNTTSFGDVVYLDLGSDNGLKTGDKFIIRRSGGIDIMKPGEGYVSQDRYQLPDKEVGEVVVISTMPKTASARVVDSNEVIKAGYRAVYKY